jgi:hypothetical protein
VKTVKQQTWIALALAVAAAVTVDAQENERATERLELTMTLLPEAARDAAEITRRIELPAPPAQPGENGEKPDQPPGQENKTSQPTRVTIARTQGAERTHRDRPRPRPANSPIDRHLPATRTDPENPVRVLGSWS